MTDERTIRSPISPQLERTCASWLCSSGKAPFSRRNVVDFPSNRRWSNPVSWLNIRHLLLFPCQDNRYELSPWFCWLDHLGLLRQWCDQRNQLFRLLLGVLWWIHVSCTFLNSANSRPDCGWTTQNITSKLSHYYVCDQWWANAAPILRATFSHPSDLSKPKPLSLWFPLSRAPSISGCSDLDWASRMFHSFYQDYLWLGWCFFPAKICCFISTGNSLLLFSSKCTDWWLLTERVSFFKFKAGIFQNSQTNTRKSSKIYSIVCCQRLSKQLNCAFSLDTTRKIKQTFCYYGRTFIDIILCSYCIRPFPWK